MSFLKKYYNEIMLLVAIITMLLTAIACFLAL